ncbi:glycosyltransferase family 2 protein [Lignipirellula cremea]|uniref:Glycosyl transferase family 2 n=1 Tax=Lignipirellula cremea TaxID=2528010 RepID=A0A518DVI3_9BACT|nr:glycosyltransferase family 2 protein [Lignipirellula cremea]QDU95845.1 Glycosyl transferase family 2 [Lignipirellula cremea]
MAEKITVLIPCKNERMNIRPCIEAARLVADEILVADSGSTDDTMDIVRDAGGCRLIEREFVNYADFKNWAIPQASHPWVFIVDADERVTPELAQEIRQLLEAPPENLQGYRVQFDGHFMGHRIRHGGWDTVDVLRLIRRDECRYRQGRVHEGFNVDPKRLGLLKNRLLHYTLWSYDQYFFKYVNYTRWGALDMWDKGKRSSTLGLLVRPFLRFFQLYILRGGFLDGRAGIQVCMLQAFFVTFVKQARLWEREHGLPQPNPEEAAEEQRRAA